MRVVSSKEFWVGVIATLVALYGYKYVSQFLAARGASAGGAGGKK